VPLALAQFSKVKAMKNTYDAAVERANSRAAVLQSLQNAYSNQGTSKGIANNKNEKAVARTSNTPTDYRAKKRQSTNITETAVSVLQQAFSTNDGTTTGNKYEKTKHFFTDQLQNKSIVLENATQADASKFSNRNRM
jgi:hypothetical protein